MHIKYVPLARVSVKARHLKQAGGDIFIKERIMSQTEWRQMATTCCCLFSLLGWSRDLPIQKTDEDKTAHPPPEGS